MATPYFAEIRIMAFNYPPKGWAFCNGQFLPINQNQALFSLLGTTYGGNGQTTFALPNLQGRVPVHMGGSYILGQTGGEQTHTLSLSELPQHMHQAQAVAANATLPTTPGSYLASADNAYLPSQAQTALHPSSVASVGGSQAHNNMQPYLALNFCIALSGAFPSQN